MPKLPWMKFWTADWLKDPALTLCTPATRGVWIDLISAMHELDQTGELRGTADQLARAARSSAVEIVQALTDLQTTGAANVTERNGVYSVRNRRMYAEATKRKSGAGRQKRFRERKRQGESNAPVTQQKLEARSSEKPPPAPSKLNPSAPDPAPLSAEWQQVVVVVRECGVEDAEAACESARDRGASTGEVRRLCETFQAHPGAWGVGLLWAMIRKIRPGEKVNWPAKSEAYEAAQRAAAPAELKARRESELEKAARERAERRAERERIKRENAASGYKMGDDYKQQIAKTEAPCTD